MRAVDLALQRKKYKHLNDDEWRWFLQQIEGRERTADKLPAFAAVEDWWYPVRLSCEQCSSEETARYKASLVSGEKMIDLTGGYGVDTFFLSKQFAHTDYIEQNAELCRLAAHNFSIQNSDIRIQNTSAEEFIQTAGQYDLIFIDPARRDSHGGKVFRLEDCTPNVVELLPVLQQHLTPNGRIMLKLSPMLDITQAITELSFVRCASSLCTLTWDVHVVAKKNEVKEVLLLSGGKGIITAIDLAEPEKAFTFTREEESLAMLNAKPSTFTYLYEPSVSILKAGAYKLVAQRYDLAKLDANTHLYTSDAFIDDFPGRVWRIQGEGMKSERMKEIQQANVLVRNYPLTAEQLKKKWHIKDGGEDYLIGCRVQGQPTLFHTTRIY